MDKASIVKALRDTAQAASNTAASTVSGPIDLLAAALRYGGIPVPENAFGGSKWMAERGLTQEVEQGIPRVVGETLGMVGPALATQFAPQIAGAINKGAANLAAPSRLNKEAGVVYGGPIAKQLDQKYGGAVDAYLMEGDKINLSKVVVPKSDRNQGIGSQFMQDLVDAADEQGKIVTLTPSSDFGGNKARLEQFYKKFDFVQNKGRNKDYEISEAMYRLPKKEGQ